MLTDKLAYTEWQISTILKIVQWVCYLKVQLKGFKVLSAVGTNNILRVPNLLLLINYGRQRSITLQSRKVHHPFYDNFLQNFEILIYLVVDYLQFINYFYRRIYGHNLLLAICGQP